MNMAGYASLLKYSRQMLELAKQQAWEPLAEAQQQRATLIAGMRTQNPPLTAAEQTAAAQTIREIQNLDREILAYVTPWRDDVAKLLARLAPSP